MQNIYLVKKNYANPLEGDTKPPEGDNSMKFVYHQLKWSRMNNCYSSIFLTEKRHNMHRPEYICIIAILVVKFSIEAIRN